MGLFSLYVLLTCFLNFVVIFSNLKSINVMRPTAFSLEFLLFCQFFGRLLWVLERNSTFCLFRPSQWPLLQSKHTLHFKWNVANSEANYTIKLGETKRQTDPCSRVYAGWMLEVHADLSALLPKDPANFSHASLEDLNLEGVLSGVLSRPSTPHPGRKAWNEDGTRMSGPFLTFKLNLPSFPATCR